MTKAMASVVVVWAVLSTPVRAQRLPVDLSEPEAAPVTPAAPAADSAATVTPATEAASAPPTQEPAQATAATPAAQDEAAPVAGTSSAEGGFDLGGPGFEMEPMAPRPVYDPDAPVDSSPVQGWFRFDVDRQGPRFWVGAVHSLGGIDLATDVYFNGPYAVLDLGVVFGFGPVSFLPMVGMGVNFAEGEAANIIGPQLFTIVDTEPIYFESWVQMYFNEVFGTYAGRLRGPGNQFYTRDFVLYNVSDHFAIGPQAELTYDFSAGSLLSLPVGGGVNVHYGEGNTLALYLAFDTQAADTDRLAGRFTFIKTW